MFSSDSSVPLLTAFVAPVGMTADCPVTPSEAIPSLCHPERSASGVEGSHPHPVFAEKRIFGQDIQDGT